jgi:prepilin-type N-terminal cleavage/methylation domain-containing protein
MLLMHACKPLFSGGFSLLEMAIGLAIVGLLVGSVVAGQNLLRASEVRSIADEEQRILSAAHTFKEKYDAIPGDMGQVQNVL